jgi:hypothetical protein
MDMIEHVARALCARLGRDPDTMGPSVVVTNMGSMGMAASLNGPLEPAWKGYEAEARTAIEAMRNADLSKMRLLLHAGTDTWTDAQELWNAVIDSALTPPPSGEM